MAQSPHWRIVSDAPDRVQGQWIDFHVWPQIVEVEKGALAQVKNSRCVCATRDI